MADWIDRLTELRRLKETGAIDDAEFERRRAEALAERGSGVSAAPSVALTPRSVRIAPDGTEPFREADGDAAPAESDLTPRPPDDAFGGERQAMDGVDELAKPAIVLPVETEATADSFKELAEPKTPAPPDSELAAPSTNPEDPALASAEVLEAAVAIEPTKPLVGETEQGGARTEITTGMVEPEGTASADVQAAAPSSESEELTLGSQPEVEAQTAPEPSAQDEQLEASGDTPVGADAPPIQSGDEPVKACARCGAHDAISARFCRACGTLFDSSQGHTPLSAAGASTKAAGDVNRPNVLLKPTIVFIAIGAVALAIVAFVAYGTMHRRSDTVPNSVTNQFTSPSGTAPAPPTVPVPPTASLSASAALSPPPVAAKLQLAKRPKEPRAPPPEAVLSAPPPPTPLPAEPPPVAAPSRMISDPVWVRRPSSADAAVLYPSRAQEDGVEGVATVDCGVTADGRLNDCGVVDERPSGEGFGSATLKLTSRFRMAPTTQSGDPAAGRRVRIPIRWRLAW